MNKFDKISKITILLKTVLKLEYYMVLAKLLGSDYEFKTQIMETFNSEKLSSYHISH